MKKADFNAISTSTIALKRERESNSRLSLDSLTTQGICHTEQGEVSKNRHCEGAKRAKQSISLNKHKIDCHDLTLSSLAMTGETHPQTTSAREEAYSHTRNDESTTQTAIPSLRADFSRRGNPQTQAQTPKSRKLALSLATASLLASASLDIAAAACQWSQDWGRGDANSHGVGRYARVDCSGSTNNLWTFFNNYQSGSYYRELRWYLAGTTSEGNISATFQKNDSNWWNANQMTTEVYFNNFNAPNTSFSFTNNNIGTVNVSLKASSLSSLTTTSSNGRFNSVSITNSSVGSFSNAGTIGTMNVNNEYGASNVGSFSNSGTISTMNVNGGSRISSFNNSGTIVTLNVGDRNASNSGFLNDFSSGTINTVNVYNTSITINGSASSWNGGSTKGEHIIANNNNNTLNIADNSIQIQAGDNIEVNGVYKFTQLAVNSSGKTVSVSSKLGYRHLADTAGLALKASPDGRGIMISADIATSYGASVYRALVLSNLRRQAMTQNILDTMTTKTFHSDRYYNQEVELRLLQYDLSRLTNRSSKFSKTTRKNQSKVDKVREKMAKLTLEQSKGQNLDKGYNNFELIDQLDAIFIPYTGRRDWRFFALPYASNSYVDLGSSSAMEYAGGAIFGVQRNLRNAGIFGGYVGYEFVNTDTELVGGVDTRIQTHSLQAGLNYFKTFSFTSKTWEGFIRANLRGGADLPQFSMLASGYNLKLASDSPDTSIPLMWNVGAEFKGGITFYYFKRNSYLSPEVNLSYDMISAPKTWIEKPLATAGGASYRPLGAHERYNTIFWHIPQIGAAVRYYKMWGNTFRTNLKAGIKYNMLNKQKAYVKIGNLSDASDITLPAVYGNLAVDFIWMIKKNHELSFGYDGLFYASSFAKEKNIRGENVKTAEWFNGVTTTLNFKYAYWFGGTDYVTDKDGNAVSRSIAEGKKGKKSSKKSSKKKSKKSKKKVYYIDG